MKKLTLALAVLGAFCIGGCSSVPKPVIRDGSERSPVNSTARIADYQARTAEETVNFNERTALGRQVDALNRQVAEVKASVASLREQIAALRQARDAKTMAVPTPRPACGAIVTSSARGETTIPGGGAIEVRDQSVIFRVTHPFARVEFTPSPELEVQLLQATAAAKHIEIRGRTDAASENPIDEAIALQRALRAKAFLVVKGIEPGKIRLNYMAAGGNIVENKTQPGRAENRRVEIEAMDLDTMPFHNEPQIAIGSGQ